jgi:hypothetical protein
MLVNVLKGSYWCPKSADIRIKNCVKAPLRERLYLHIEEVCAKKKLNIAWIDESHVPDKKWMVDVLATLDPDNEIFKKDYVAPPIRKRLRDIETIVLPNEIFEGLPHTSRKVKARRMKITSEAFAAEKASRYRDMQKELYEQMVEQE